MEDNLNIILHGNNHIPNAVNCFTKKLKLIEAHNELEFNIESNLLMTYSPYNFAYNIIGNVTEPILLEIKQAYSDCFLKEPQDEPQDETLDETES